MAIVSCKNICVEIVIVFRPILFDLVLVYLCTVQGDLKRHNRKTDEISRWDSLMQRRARLICALSIVKFVCVNMYLWDLFLSKLTFTSENFACCQQNKIEETMSNLYNNDPIDRYFNSRHERSIIRMCALLWVLKVHEDNVNRRQDSQDVYNSGSNSSTGNCKTSKVRFVE